MQSFFFSSSAHSGKQFMGTSSKLAGSLYVLTLRLKLSVNVLAKIFLENEKH
jgi:hypothetical protein